MTDFVTELRARLDRARLHVDALERLLELEISTGGGGTAPGARAPRDATRQHAPTQARSSAQPVETGKNGEPPSAARSPAKRLRQPAPADIPAGKKWCSRCYCRDCKKEYDGGRWKNGRTSELQQARRAPVPGSGEATKRMALIKERAKAALQARAAEDADAPPELEHDDERLPSARELLG